MKLDVNMEFKRSLLTGIGMVCATVALCVGALDKVSYLAIMGGGWATYFGTRTIEEGKKRNHEAYISDNMRAARERAAASGQ